MLGFLSKLFGPDDTTSFYNLHNNLVKWNTYKVYPNDYELKPYLSFPSDFWNKITPLYKDTLADKHERAITVFWCDGEVVVSSVTRGTTSMVTPRNNISVSYRPIPHRKDYFRKEVLLDGKLYLKRDVYYQKVPKQKDLRVMTLFNLHTHPPHEYEGRNYYSFFSLQDLKSLLGSGAVITGMISDRLWILFRTNQTPKVLNNFEESEITVQTLAERLKLGVYTGGFGQKLKRVYLNEQE